MKIDLAINQVMERVGAIGKEKRNTQQGFNYRGVDDVMNALQKEFIAAKIYVVPEVLEMTRQERQTKTSTLLYTILKMRYKFVCAEDGTFVEAVVIGEGMDSGDKSANKAMSVAFKYACLQIFCIPTEEQKDASMIDPDRESYSVEPMKGKRSATAEQMNALRFAPYNSGEYAGLTLEQIYENNRPLFDYLYQQAPDGIRNLCGIVMNYYNGR